MRRSAHWAIRHKPLTIAPSHSTQNDVPTAANLLVSNAERRVPARVPRATDHRFSVCVEYEEAQVNVRAIRDQSSLLRSSRLQTSAYRHAYLVLPTIASLLVSNTKKRRLVCAPHVINRRFSDGTDCRQAHTGILISHCRCALLCRPCVRQALIWTFDLDQNQRSSTVHIVDMHQTCLEDLSGASN